MSRCKSCNNTIERPRKIQVAPGQYIEDVICSSCLKEVPRTYTTNDGKYCLEKGAIEGLDQVTRDECVLFRIKTEGVIKTAEY